MNGRLRYVRSFGKGFGRLFLIPFYTSFNITELSTFQRAVVGGRNLVKKYLLNVKDLKGIPASKQLEMGDEILRERMIPMSPQLTNMVTQIYENCSHEWTSVSQSDTTMLSFNVSYLMKEIINGLTIKLLSLYDPGFRVFDTPLMKALEKGLMNMVWGFIECVKQTNSNLLTHEVGDEAVREFLWLPNKRNGDTAFDVAMAKNQAEVATLLLNHAPLSCLEAQWVRRRGKTLIPLLNSDSKNDTVIFSMLEKEKRGQLNLNPPASNQDSPQESIINTESIANLRNETQEILRNLDHDLLVSELNGNTILHLVSKFGDVKYVQEILENQPSMICCRNSNGETPAYVAAREGHADILQIMFRHIKEDIEDTESIVTRRTDNQNALHIAIQNHHVEVVFLLIEEIPQLANCINGFKQSPLYIAAERKYHGILSLMLEKCPEISFEGPNDKTALHAAAISDSAECIEYLLKKNSDLLNNKDKHGWTSFRYAVYHNSSLATAELLKWDNSIGYKLMTEDEIDTSAIHIAASRGHYETMKVLMSKCPGCSEFIDKKGRNILHLAVENKKDKVIEYIFQDESLTSLINKTDNTGNTPVRLLLDSNFELAAKVMNFRVDINVLNNEENTPLKKTSSDNQRETLVKRIATGTSIDIKKNTRSANINKYELKEKELEAKQKEAEARFKIAENLVIVVTLIATATFAAGITLPGGLHSGDDSKQGTPFLLRKAVFKAFVVSDAIAFSCSCAVLLIYVALMMFRNQYVKASSAVQAYVDNRIVDMYILTALSLVAMAIAFFSGVYVVLTPSLALAISTCATSALIILLPVWIQIDSI